MATFGKSDFIEVGSIRPQMSRQGPYAGQNRIDIVDKKIELKLPFILGPKEGGQKVYGVFFLSKTGETPTTKNWPWILGYSKNQNWKLGDPSETLNINQFYKDPDFGGGGSGSGGGAPQTDATESGCAYYCSLVFNVVQRHLHCGDITDDNMKEAVKYTDATTSYHKFKKDGPQDWIDNDVYVKTANAVYEKYGDKFKKAGGKVYCHRGSNFMKEIYKAKKAAHDWDKKNDMLAPGSFLPDKWNPGDIWLSTFAKNSKPLKPCLNFNDLKKCVLDYAGEGQFPETKLLAVSLKKVDTSTTTATVTEYNKWTDPNKRAHNPDKSVKYEGFTFGRKGDFFSSNDIYIQFTTGQEMQMRAGSTTQAWMGLLLGATAYGGKIGGGNVQFYVDQKGGSITYKPTEKKVNWSEMKANQVKWKDFHDLYVKYLPLQNLPGADKFVSDDDYCDQLSEFKDKINKKSNTPAFKFGKNMGLMFIDAMENLSPDSQAHVCTEVVRYAASNTDLSTYFIKVE
jgi:hypothetical protein